MISTIRNLIITTIIALVPVVGLLNSYLKRLDLLSGNFQRSYPYEYSSLKSYDLGYNSYYIAGNISDDLYLGNVSVKPRLLKLSALLTDTSVIKINIPPGNESLSTYRIMVDSPAFYVCYGIQRTVFKGEAEKWEIKGRKPGSPNFHDVVAIGKNSMVYAFVNSKNENSLRKISDNGKQIDNDHVLEKQVDGLFCTSGILGYNKQLNVLTYLYAYRNQILVLDTNLNLIRKIKTIDDIDTARFEVSTVHSTGSKVITKPTILVNSKCATYGKYLLVHSKIMGKHEDDKLFEHSTIIDIYNIESGSYVYSFSLPNNKKIDISQLKVINKEIYTISGRFINKFTLKLPE